MFSPSLPPMLPVFLLDAVRLSGKTFFDCGDVQVIRVHTLSSFSMSLHGDILCSLLLAISIIPNHVGAFSVLDGDVGSEEANCCLPLFQQERTRSFDGFSMHSLENSLIDIMRAEQDSLKGWFPHLQYRERDSFPHCWLWINTAVCCMYLTANRNLVSFINADNKL